MSTRPPVRGRSPAASAGVRAALLLAAALLAGCSRPGEDLREHAVPGGDAELGVALLQDYGCELCHAIPGVTERPLIEGPPLDDWSERQYIAGALPNDAGNLIRWIVDPKGVEPGTAMPDLGVTPEDARHIAAYLYTLGEATPPAPTDLPATREIY